MGLVAPWRLLWSNIGIQIVANRVFVHVDVILPDKAQSIACLWLLAIVLHVRTIVRLVYNITSQCALYFDL